MGKSTDTLIVGDLHGKYEVVERVLATDYNIVFIGDYLDSYDRSPEDCLRTLQLVTDAAKDQHERVTALMGNHEMSYLDLSMRCSGFSHKTEAGLPIGWASVLNFYVWVEGYLVSHAGVTSTLLDQRGLSLPGYLASHDFCSIGRVRGGNNNNIGGLLWCDWHDEFVPVAEVPQIVGHSQRRPDQDEQGILQMDGNFNVDCLDTSEEFLLVGAREEPKVVTL